MSSDQNPGLALVWHASDHRGRRDVGTAIGAPINTIHQQMLGTLWSMSTGADGVIRRVHLTGHHADGIRYRYGAVLIHLRRHPAGTLVLDPHDTLCGCFPTTLDGTGPPADHPAALCPPPVAPPPDTPQPGVVISRCAWSWNGHTMPDAGST